MKQADLIALIHQGEGRFFRVATVPSEIIVDLTQGTYRSRTTTQERKLAEANVMFPFHTSEGDVISVYDRTNDDHLSAMTSAVLETQREADSEY